MSVTLTLTDGQVAEVLRDVSADTARAFVFSGLSELERLRALVAPSLADPTCSTETLRALLVLAAFPEDGGERTVTEIAGEVGFSPSTIHRYIGSWMAAGFLAQDPRSRRYRRAAVRTPATRGCERAS